MLAGADFQQSRQGFQGQEKDIIILSCVRGGSADKGIGFLSGEPPLSLITRLVADLSARRHSVRSLRASAF